MGYYIEAPVNKGKAKWLEEKFVANIVRKEVAKELVDSSIIGVVCIVDNGLFEAAGYMFSMAEFEQFSRPEDSRPKTWMVMMKRDAERLSGYK